VNVTSADYFDGIFATQILNDCISNSNGLCGGLHSRFITIVLCGLAADSFEI
jgi:hypothetical protein